MNEGTSQRDLVRRMCVVLCIEFVVLAALLWYEKISAGQLICVALATVGVLPRVFGRPLDPDGDEPEES